MKSTLITFSLLCVFTSGAQEKNEPIRIDSNGVKVFQAEGIENATHLSEKPSSIESNSQRNIKDWNLEECENALYYIDLKINSLVEEGGNFEAIKEYELQVAEISVRKQELIIR